MGDDALRHHVHGAQARGILRVSEEDERVGADVSKHGGEAYPEMAKAKAADAPKSATVQLGLTDQKPKTEGV